MANLQPTEPEPDFGIQLTSTIEVRANNSRTGAGIKGIQFRVDRDFAGGGGTWTGVTDDNGFVSLQVSNAMWLNEGFTISIAGVPAGYTSSSGVNQQSIMMMGGQTQRLTFAFDYSGTDPGGHEQSGLDRVITFLVSNWWLIAIPVGFGVLLMVVKITEAFKPEAKGAK